MRIITPITPTAFFKILPQPMMLSTESPKIFPTTGIKFEIAAFAVFAVIPSTELLNVPSMDNEQTKMVRIIPKIQTMEDFKNLDNRSICILSETLDMIPKCHGNKKQWYDEVGNKISDKTNHK